LIPTTDIFIDDGHDFLGILCTFKKSFPFLSIMTTVFTIGFIWRKTNNVFWYETTKENKMTMIIIA
jgi:hypothetical protein